MHDIKRKYEEFVKLSFPADLRGEEFLGIDLILLHRKLMDF